jgi:hypothetical protein
MYNEVGACFPAVAGGRGREEAAVGETFGKGSGDN